MGSSQSSTSGTSNNVRPTPPQGASDSPEANTTGDISPRTPSALNPGIHNLDPLHTGSDPLSSITPTQLLPAEFRPLDTPLEAGGLGSALANHIAQDSAELFDSELGRFVEAQLSQSCLAGTDLSTRILYHVLYLLFPPELSDYRNEASVHELISGFSGMRYEHIDDDTTLSKAELNVSVHFKEDIIDLARLSRDQMQTDVNYPDNNGRYVVTAEVDRADNSIVEMRIRFSYPRDSLPADFRPLETPLSGGGLGKDLSNQIARLYPDLVDTDMGYFAEQALCQLVADASDGQARALYHVIGMLFPPELSEHRTEAFVHELISGFSGMHYEHIDEDATSLKAKLNVSVHLKNEIVDLTRLNRDLMRLKVNNRDNIGRYVVTAEVDLADDSVVDTSIRFSFPKAALDLPPDFRRLETPLSEGGLGKDLSNQMARLYPELVDSEIDHFATNELCRLLGDERRGQTHALYRAMYLHFPPEKRSDDFAHELIVGFSKLDYKHIEDDAFFMRAEMSCRVHLNKDKHDLPRLDPREQTEHTVHTSHPRNNRGFAVKATTEPKFRDRLTINAWFSLPRTQLNTDITLSRGDEFKALSAVLSNEPNKFITKISYDNEPAADFGGPIRELFTGAFNQALSRLTIATQLHGGTHDFNSQLDLSEVDELADDYASLGRLLCYVSLHDGLSLPGSLSEPTLSSIYLLSIQLEAFDLPAELTASALVGQIHSVLREKPTVVFSLLKELAPSAYDHVSESINAYVRARTTLDASSTADLTCAGEYLDEFVGIAYDEESESFTMAEGNARFAQLILVAIGFKQIQEARIGSETGVRTPQQVYNDIVGKSLRKVLTDSTDTQYFRVIKESGVDDDVISAFDLSDLKLLINKWAEQAEEEQIDQVCEAITGCAVLPRLLNNNTNTIHFSIDNLHDAEYSLNTCFGTLKMTPSLVHEIVDESRRQPESLPTKLISFFEEVANTREIFTSD